MILKNEAEAFEQIKAAAGMLRCSKNTVLGKLGDTLFELINNHTRFLTQ